jgi:hypothetical protein
MRTTLLLALAPLAAGVVRAQGTMQMQDTTKPRPAATITVTEAVVAQTVVDRAPQDTGSAFPATVAQLVCFTKVSGGSAGTTVHHVWFHGETQVADIELHVDGSPWRTWSRKTIPAEWTGAWHVEVRDAAGNVLKRIDFTVGS